jgi:hypothetical protein
LYGRARSRQPSRTWSHIHRAKLELLGLPRALKCHYQRCSPKSLPGAVWQTHSKRDHPRAVWVLAGQIHSKGDHPPAVWVLGRCPCKIRLPAPLGL